MNVAGLDIGSRTISFVVLRDSEVTETQVTDTGVDPFLEAKNLINGGRIERIIATGYGRHMAAARGLAHDTITEIKAYALGAFHLYPDVQTILDVGGQDSKVIRVDSGGAVLRFEMNDRCAAGTGRFLENISRGLGLEVDQFGEHALGAGGTAVRLSSMCTVFAESEVVSLIGRGVDSHHVALGVHRAIVERLSTMVRRIGLGRRFVFAGGVARNPCVNQLLAGMLGIMPTVPENPQVVGALGAALHAASQRAHDTIRSKRKES